ncbi:predicted protein [Sparassis crispa]|uniref:NAD(P)-binding protein n=1 Tax=Sparassis crispa TaxID=139825 RepID=A0A401GB79_9APHY|nr:predicted protein [Sparassis crispa]GBE79428.1 predicted protein [Sparassis crispa]
MPPRLYPFILVAPSTRGLSLAITRHLLQTTTLPVFATHRTNTPDAVHMRIMDSLAGVDQTRLKVLPLDLTSEDSIVCASRALADALPKDSNPFIHAAFFSGGILHPERQPGDLVLENIQQTFEINVISHLLLIKHFSRFLPSPGTQTTHPHAQSAPTLSKWVHVSARVGSISDNRLGGWYSYRSSKAALNQVVRTFDLHLQARKIPALCVGVHPGTVKTDFSRQFWSNVRAEDLFEPEFAAQRLVDVVKGLRPEDRGKVWDWEGKEVPP